MRYQQDDATGQALADAAIRSAEYFGLEVVANECFLVRTSDYYPAAIKLVSLNPDLIIAATAWKELRELGYEGLGACWMWTSAIGDQMGWDTAESRILPLSTSVAMAPS